MTERKTTESNMPVLEFPQSAEDAASFDYIGSVEQVLKETDSETVRIRWGELQGLILTNPEQLNTLLTKGVRSTVKGPIYGIIRDVLGEGTLTMDGSAWRASRTRINKGLNRPRIKAMLDTIADAGDEYFNDLGDRIDANDAPDLDIDLKTEMSVLSFDTLVAVLLGRHAFDALDDVTYENTLKNTFDVAKLNRGEVPPEVADKIKSTRQYLTSLSMKMIEHARSHEPDDSLVSVLAYATDENKNYLDDEVISEELSNLAFAGYEATSIALTAMNMLLQDHPEVKGRMREEASAVLGKTGKPNAEMLPQLTYTDQVLREVLRHKPPTPIIARLAIENFALGDLDIQAGTLLLPFIWGVHHNPRYWDSPDTFDPDRFAPENMTEKAKEAYMPFIRGSRICAGMHLALAELTVHAARMVRDFDVKVPEDAEMKMNLVLEATRTDAKISKVHA